MADEQTLELMLSVLKRAKRPLMIGELATLMGVSRPTASKYVDVGEAARLVKCDRYATARRVVLVTGSGRKKEDAL